MYRPRPISVCVKVKGLSSLIVLFTQTGGLRIFYLSYSELTILSFAVLHDLESHINKINKYKMRFS